MPRPHACARSLTRHPSLARCSVFAVRFSGDGLYCFSGSEDMNVRVWKAEADAQVGPVRVQHAAIKHAVLRVLLLL